MITTETLVNENDILGPIVVPRDHYVQAFVQYGAGGAGTIVLEITLNGTDWVIVGMNPITGAAVVLSLAAAGIASADVSGASSVRLRCSVAGAGVVASLSLPSA